MHDVAGSAPGSEELVVLERRDDGVAVVTLNRPKRNALSTAVLHRLQEVVDDLVGELPGAVVLWGGARQFSVGADIKELSQPGMPAPVAGALHDVTGALAALPCVTIAAITGVALGGGLELALACDLRVASADARLGQPEILLGIIPGGGGTQRLARLIGTARAKDMVLTGRQVDAPEALRLGLVDRVVADAGRGASAGALALDLALELAAPLARGPRRAQALAKQAIDQGMALSLADGLRNEMLLFCSVFETDDAKVGLDSFLELGPGRAQFTGR